jgi:hypothetical protein
MVRLLFDACLLVKQFPANLRIHPSAATADHSNESTGKPAERKARGVKPQLWIYAVIR